MIKNCNNCKYYEEVKDCSECKNEEYLNSKETMLELHDGNIENDYCKYYEEDKEKGDDSNENK